MSQFFWTYYAWEISSSQKIDAKPFLPNYEIKMTYNSQYTTGPHSFAEACTSFGAKLFKILKITPVQNIQLPRQDFH